MNIVNARQALRYADWDNLLLAADGETFAVKVGNEAVLATKVFSEDKDDGDEDRNVAVVIRLGDQYFRKTGHSGIGSHCYGEYETSWTDLTEVTPRQVTLTVYE